jgi:hypothetical protein
MLVFSHPRSFGRQPATGWVNAQDYAQALSFTVPFCRHTGSSRLLRVVAVQQRRLLGTN